MSDVEPRDSVQTVLTQWAEVRPDLDVSPIAVLARVAKIRAVAVARQEAQFANFELTPADFVTLVALRRRLPPYRMTQSDLAASMGLSGGTMSLRVDRLLARSLATRTADALDRRVQWIELTTHGESLFEELVPLHLASQAELLSPLTERQSEQLAELLGVWLAGLEAESR